MDIAETFLARSRHYLGVEYPAKLRLCLRALPDDALWRRPNEHSNSIGNLLVHLTGNVRQWIVGGVGGRIVERDRESEFARRDGPPQDVLLAELEKVLREADEVLAALSPAMLTERRAIQSRDTTVLEAIYHVVEHFSMHTGQIILLTKSVAPGAVQFYDDAGGRAIPIWNRTG
jgi:uncharacterized damage-inducible protein DinB